MEISKEEWRREENVRKKDIEKSRGERIKNEND
jgi:hypothetical protein